MNRYRGGDNKVLHIPCNIPVIESLTMANKKSTHANHSANNFCFCVLSFCLSFIKMQTTCYQSHGHAVNSHRLLDVLLLKFVHVYVCLVACKAYFLAFVCSNVSLCLPATNYAICCSPLILQTVWTQIRPDRPWGLI